MFFEVVLLSIFGVFAGIITGLTPGLHVNNIAAAILSALPLLLQQFSPYAIACFIVSMAITHTIFDFIPSTLLGIPEDDTCLSTLPAHKMVLQGKAYEAIYLTVVGGFISTLIVVFTLPLLLFLMPNLYSILKPSIPYILVFVLIFIILTEKNKIAATMSLTLSGILGIICLDILPISAQSLFPAIFSGLFGMPTLILGLKSKRIPKQKFHANVNLPNAIKGSFKAVVAGVLLGMLPGLGSAQASFIIDAATKRKNEKELLVALGGVNTIVAIISIISLYAIGRARSGAAVAISHIIPELTTNFLILTVLVAIFSVSLACFLLLHFCKSLISLLSKVSYQKLLMGILIFITILVFVTSKFIGLLILAISTSIGLYTILSGVRRSVCMNVLILPLLLFYFGIFF